MSVHEEFLDRLQERIANLQVGDPLSPRTEISPVIDPEHTREVREYISGGISDDMTVLMCKGKDKSDTAGAPVHPTVFTDVDDDTTVSSEEVFGPVLSVFEFSHREGVLT